jgi:hypothetical protein
MRTFVESLEANKGSEDDPLCRVPRVCPVSGMKSVQEFLLCEVSAPDRGAVAGRDRGRRWACDGS